MAFSESGQHALESAGDWTKVSTSLAAGALVFGIGLNAYAASMSPWVRVVLSIAWFLFFLAVILGIFAHASIPVMMQDENYDLEYFAFAYPGRAHQLAFLAGVLLLAMTLIDLLVVAPSSEDFRANTAAQALAIAQTALPAGSRIARITTLELIKGSDAVRPQDGTWHIALDFDKFRTTSNLKVTSRHAEVWKRRRAIDPILAARI